MVAAADQAGVVLMVGTMKRYDPAYERLLERLPDVEDVRLVRCTTLESPLEPYVAHYPLVGPDGPGPGGTDPDAGALDDALGSGADDETRWIYRTLLLDCLIHELNMLRGALGEPTSVNFARLERERVSVHLSFGEIACQINWVDLPGIARYRQDIDFYAGNGRLGLHLPSPFLRNAPSLLVAEGGEAGTADGWRKEEIVGYDEAFRRELVAFADAIVDQVPTRNPGIDGLRDVMLCQAIAKSHMTGAPVANPTAA